MNIKLAEKIELDSIQMRDVYAGCIVGMIEHGEPIMVLDADLMRPLGILPYKDKYPENIIDCGIAEANMIGVACGLSAEGFVPFTHSFAAFASRRVSGAERRHSHGVRGRGHDARCSGNDNNRTD